MDKKKFFVDAKIDFLLTNEEIITSLVTMSVGKDEGVAGIEDGNGEIL